MFYFSQGLHRADSNGTKDDPSGAEKEIESILLEHSRYSQCSFVCLFSHVLTDCCHEDLAANDSCKVMLYSHDLVSAHHISFLRSKGGMRLYVVCFLFHLVILLSVDSSLQFTFRIINLTINTAFCFH